MAAWPQEMQEFQGHFSSISTGFARYRLGSEPVGERSPCPRGPGPHGGPGSSVCFGALVISGTPSGVRRGRSGDPQEPSARCGMCGAQGRVIPGPFQSAPYEAPQRPDSERSMAAWPGKQEEIARLCRPSPEDVARWDQATCRRRSASRNLASRYQGDWSAPTPQPRRACPGADAGTTTCLNSYAHR